MTQAKLASRASDLKRRIYASLPFSYRFAQLLFHLKIADDFIKRNLGRALYAEFIKAGVTGMPDVKGEDAEDFKEKIIKLKDRGPMVLPMGYGAAFGGEMWGVATKVLGKRDPSSVADVLQNVVAEIYARDERDAKTKLKAKPLASAESYVKWLVGKRAQDLLKKQRPTDSLTEPETGGQANLTDTRVLRGLLHMVDRSDLPALKREIDKIDKENPDRPWSYIEGIIEGLRPSDIARQWGVDRAVPSRKFKDWLPELQRIFREFTGQEGYAEAI